MSVVSKPGTKVYVIETLVDLIEAAIEDETEISPLFLLISDLEEACQLLREYMALLEKQEK